MISVILFSNQDSVNARQDTMNSIIPATKSIRRRILNRSLSASLQLSSILNKDSACLVQSDAFLVPTPINVSNAVQNSHSVTTTHTIANKNVETERDLFRNAMTEITMTMMDAPETAKLKMASFAKEDLLTLRITAQVRSQSSWSS